jgi:hypothetical protein
LAKPEAPKRIGDHLQTVCAIVSKTLYAWVIRRNTGLFNIKDLEPESLEANEIMNKLPRHPGHGELAK